MPIIKTVIDYSKLEPVTADVRLSYGSDGEQFGDLYLPENDNKPYPIIVLLHGGCWRAEHGLQPLGKISKALTSLGFAVWNVEYRRLGNGGGWPMTFMDVARGTDFLRNIAEEYSLNLSKVITMGHSAGGHLALWLAARARLPRTSEVHMKNPLAITAVISLAGIPDLDSAAEQNICRGACEELMGGLPKNYPERYQQGSPHHLSLSGIPQIHLLGELDPIVPMNYLQTALERQTDPYTLEVIPEIGHFEMVMPNSISWRYIKQSLTSISS